MALIWLRLTTLIFLLTAIIVLFLHAFTGANPGSTLEYVRFYPSRSITTYAYVDVESHLTLHRFQAITSILPRMSNTDSSSRQVVPLYTFGNYDLFILEPSGKFTQITDVSDFARIIPWASYVSEYATWSPDERWIGFLHVTIHQADVYAIRPDGSQLRRLAQDIDNGIPPNWVAFSQRDLMERVIASGLALFLIGLLIFEPRRHGEHRALR